MSMSQSSVDAPHAFSTCRTISRHKAEQMQFGLAPTLPKRPTSEWRSSDCQMRVILLSCDLLSMTHVSE